MSEVLWLVPKPTTVSLSARILTHTALVRRNQHQHVKCNRSRQPLVGNMWTQWSGNFALSDAFLIQQSESYMALPVLCTHCSEPYS